MKPMSLACVLACFTLTAGSASALDLSLGAAANVELGGDSGLSLGVGANADASKAQAVSQAAAGDKQGAAASSSPAASEDPLAPVLRLIGSSKWQADSFAHLETVAGSTYPVSTWVTAGNQAELKAALDTNADQIAQLHAAINANAAFTAWLKQRGVEPSQVVAVGTTIGGSLAVFTN